MNKERRLTREHASDIEKMKHILELSTSVVAKVRVFGGDEQDEFQVIREDGRVEGIFKSWAVPVIPFIEAGLEKELTRGISTDGSDFWMSVGENGVGVVSEWVNRMRREPIKFWSSLEKWRALTEQQDRRLAKIFFERVLPVERNERVAELILRLRVAFGVAAPFYHLEAIVGGESSWFNPVEENIENCGGGSLDVIGLALPSALGEKVVASRLNWGGLDWEQISKMTEGGVVNDPDLVLAFQLARKIGVSTEDVIFAANALQFIPVSVGGKKEDMRQLDARKIIFNALSESDQGASATAVARNLNALIRFLNWFPLNHRAENFNGDDWRYAAVCDTASQLVTEFAKGRLFEPEFDSVFVSKLASQVAQVDATSAKGRFILGLISEGHLGPELSEILERRSKPFIEDISSELVRLSNEEAIIDISEARVRALVGGKAAGLREARLIFGEEAVVPGKVVTTEFVVNWIKSDPVLASLVVEIQQINGIDEKLLLAEQIQRKIEALDLPVWFKEKLTGSTDNWDLWAVRSSSFDEDTIGNGAAAGIYDSRLKVVAYGLGEAIKSVIASFFGEKAVSYRHLHRLSDDPLMAVVVQPFIEGFGGVVFSGGNQSDFEVVVGETPEMIVSATSASFDSLKRIGRKETSHFSAGLMSPEMARKVGELAVLAERATGGRADIEFVTNGDGFWILQMRTLTEKKHDAHKSNVTMEKLIDVNVGSGNGWDLQGPSRLIISPEVDIEVFQGELFRRLIKNRDVVREVVLSRRIPRTSHFANICLGLGIKLTFTK